MGEWVGVEGGRCADARVSQRLRKAALICASARRTVEEECARITLLGRRMFNDLPVNAS